jgi:hypothetical protein
MTQLALLQGNVVVSVFPLPATHYPDIAALLVECPDTVADNWTFVGGAWSAPVTPPLTTIPILAYMARFTATEFAANMMWAITLVAGAASNGGLIDVTNPTLLADLAAAVAAGTLTQARVTRVQDLTQSSP